MDPIATAFLAVGGVGLAVLLLALVLGDADLGDADTDGDGRGCLHRLLAGRFRQHRQQLARGAHQRALRRVGRPPERVHHRAHGGRRRRPVRRPELTAPHQAGSSRGPGPPWDA